MNPNITKQDRDLNFMLVCRPFCETDIWSFYFEAEKVLKLAMHQTGVDLKDCVVFDESIVFYAIGNFAPIILKFVVDNGAPLNVKNRNGQTPLEFANLMLQRVKAQRPNDIGLFQLASYNVDYLEHRTK